MYQNFVHCNWPVVPRIQSKIKGSVSKKKDFQINVTAGRKPS